jgi:hypothetical protein
MELTLFVSLPPGCPEAEDPANLESFGGEDPKPEPYIPSGPSLPALTLPCFLQTA